MHFVMRRFLALVDYFRVDHLDTVLSTDRVLCLQIPCFGATGKTVCMAGGFKMLHLGLADVLSGNFGEMGERRRSLT